MLHKYFCNPKVAGHKFMHLLSRASFQLVITLSTPLLQAWYFTTEPLMTAMPCPSPMPRGCAWRTQQSWQRQASYRLPSLMAMTTAMLAGCLTRLSGKVFSSEYMHSRCFKSPGLSLWLLEQLWRGHTSLSLWLLEWCEWVIHTVSIITVLMIAVNGIIRSDISAK